MDLKHFLSFFDQSVAVPNAEISGFFIDSRQLSEDGIFFALKGEKTDGHQYVSTVLESGAALCVVEEGKRQILPKSDRYLFVQDTLKALHSIARKVALEQNVPILGITGSVGKTTTKDFLYTLLKDELKVYVSPRSYNSQLTFPLNILNAPCGKDIWILEMGLSQKGEMAKLLEIAAPTYALLLPIAVSHIGFFSGLDEYALEKGHLFSHKKTQWALLMEDTYKVDQISQIGSCIKHKISYQNKLFSIDDRQDILFFQNKGKLSCSIEHVQRQHRENLLLACHAAYYLGVKAEKILGSVANITASPGRFCVYEKQGVHYIDDTYNAAPLAVLKAIESVSCNQKKGRKIALLADMLELGSESDHFHCEVLKKAVKDLDLIITLGKAYKKNAQEHFCEESKIKGYDDFEHAWKQLKKEIKEGDTVLIKGARSFKLERAFKELALGSYGH